MKPVVPRAVSGLRSGLMCVFSVSPVNIYLISLRLDFLLGEMELIIVSATLMVFRIK